MFRYFERQDLVQSVSVLEGKDSEHTPELDKSQQGVFDLSIKSTPEDWLIRGDNLMSKGVFAADCFHKSGDRIKEHNAQALHLHCEAKREADVSVNYEGLLKASEAFLVASEFANAGMRAKTWSISLLGVDK